MAKKTKFGSESEFEKHVRQKATIAHETPQFFHKKGVFKDSSAGAGDAGAPVKLNAQGDLDDTMLPPEVLVDNQPLSASRKVHISDSSPSGGDNGDIWLEY